MNAQQPASRLTVEAVVIRADGTREDLGVVASNDPAQPGDVQHTIEGEEQSDV
jgi:hypothetical protein